MWKVNHILIYFFSSSKSGDTSSLSFWSCCWRIVDTPKPPPLSILSDKASVKNESSFIEDLGADSLDTVELVMALEEEFDTEIPDDEAEKITTVQQAIDYINKNQS